MQEGEEEPTESDVESLNLHSDDDAGHQDDETAELFHGTEQMLNEIEDEVSSNDNLPVVETK